MRELAIDTLGRIAGLHAGTPGAPRVLALHGWLDNAASFLPLAPFLDGIELVAIDMPGHGRSAHLPAGADYSFAGALDQPAGRCRCAGLGPFGLLGHSMGGAIASLLAAACPNGDSPAGDRGDRDARRNPEQTVPRLRDALAAQRAARQAPRCSRRRQRGACAPVRQSGAGQRPGARPRSACWWHAACAVDGGYTWSSDPRLTLPTLVRMTEAQVEALVAGIACPVRAIFADPAQPYLPDALRRSRTRLLPAGEIVVMPGGHHLHATARGGRRGDRGFPARRLGAGAGRRQSFGNMHWRQCEARNASSKRPPAKEAAAAARATECLPCKPVANTVSDHAANGQASPCTPWRSSSHSVATKQDDHRPQQQGAPEQPRAPAIVGPVVVLRALRHPMRPWGGGIGGRLSRLRGRCARRAGSRRRRTWRAGKPLAARPCCRPGCCRRPPASPFRASSRAPHRLLDLLRQRRDRHVGLHVHHLHPRHVHRALDPALRRRWRSPGSRPAGRPSRLRRRTRSDVAFVRLDRYRVAIPSRCPPCCPWPALMAASMAVSCAFSCAFWQPVAKASAASASAKPEPVFMQSSP